MRPQLSDHWTSWYFSILRSLQMRRSGDKHPGIQQGDILLDGPSLTTTCPHHLDWGTTRELLVVLVREQASLFLGSSLLGSPTGMCSLQTLQGLTSHAFVSKFKRSVKGTRKHSSLLFLLFSMTHDRKESSDMYQRTPLVLLRLHARY